MGLIDADAVLDKILGYDEYFEDCGCGYISLDAVVSEFNHAEVVDAVPVSFIESEIKRMDDDINTAMNDGEPEWAERSITRQTTLQMLVEMWRLKRKEK